MVILYHVDGYTIWVGVDQFENEELIHFSQRYMTQTGLTLLWHHVDKYSSPHAYVVLHDGESSAPRKLTDICCQICKDGSIEGTKHPAVDVVRTPATNLMKSKGMNPGQVSFHDRRLVSVEHGVRKINQILKFIQTVRSECTVSDLEEELEDIVKNKRKGKCRVEGADGGLKVDNDDDDDEWGEQKPKKKDPREMAKEAKEMLNNIPKEEFDPNMEDDFM